MLEAKRFLVWTDRGPAAADFEARMATAGADAVDDLGDGRRFYLYTDVDAPSSNLEARFAALGVAPVENLGEAGKRWLVWTTKGEAAANFEERLLALVPQT